MGRLTASMPVIVEPDARVRGMSDRQLLDVLMRSPAEAKPCTRPGSDQMEWLRPATSRLSDRGAAVREEMRARRLCAGCPVLGECLELSLRGGPVEGVQGGATERSRQTLRYRRAGQPGAGHPRPGSGHCPKASGRPGPGGQSPGQPPRAMFPNHWQAIEEVAMLPVDTLGEGGVAW